MVQAESAAYKLLGEGSFPVPKGLGQAALPLPRGLGEEALPVPKGFQPQTATPEEQLGQPAQH